MTWYNYIQQFMNYESMNRVKQMTTSLVCIKVVVRAEIQLRDFIQTLERYYL